MKASITRGRRRGLLLLVAAACLFAACLAPAAGASAQVTGGTLTLLTDPPQSEAMFLGGIAPYFVPPATLRLTDDAWRFRMPIAGGHLETASGAGTVSARGGFVLWGRETMSAWLQMSFTKPTLTTGAHAALSAVYWLSGRHVLATLDMSHASITPSHAGGHDWVTVAGVRARMTPWLKHQLTTAFPRYEPTGSRLGTVTVKARLK